MGKHGCTVQNGSIPEILLYLGKYSCISAKNIWAKCFHLGSIVVSEQMLLYLRQLVVFGQKGYI